MNHLKDVVINKNNDKVRKVLSIYFRDEALI